MHKSLLVPYSLLVEHEHLLGLIASEDHVWVESVVMPHEWILNVISSNFLEVFNVYNVFTNLSEWKSFVENDLFGMW